jgi:hypothetical protein
MVAEEGDIIYLRPRENAMDWIELCCDRCVMIFQASAETTPRYSIAIIYIYRGQLRSDSRSSQLCITL